MPVRLKRLSTHHNFSRAHRQRKRIITVISAEFFCRASHHRRTSYHIFFLHAIRKYYTVTIKFFRRVRTLNYYHECICINFYHVHFWIIFYHDAFVIKRPYLETPCFYARYTIFYQEYIQKNRILSRACPYKINFIAAIIWINDNFLDKFPQDRQSPV